MATPQEMVVHHLTASIGLLEIYLSGFCDHNGLAQTPNLPNHPIWTLNHLGWTFQRAANLLDRYPPGRPPKNPDVGVHSVPRVDREYYPNFEESRSYFYHSAQRLFHAIGDSDPSRWDEIAGWGRLRTIRDVLMTQAFHVGVHGGQILDLRRALKMPKLIPQLPL